MQEFKFAYDSLVEGPGFEPSVPRFRDGSFRLYGTSRSAAKPDSFLRGGLAVRIRLPPRRRVSEEPHRLDSC